MQAATDAFEENMIRVRALHAIHNSFSARITGGIDLNDMLRAELFLAVSALYHFIHEMTRLGMLECWTGRRRVAAAFGQFHLPISVAAGLSNSPVAVNMIDTEIRQRHGFLSFQHPDKIADAIRLFSDVKLW